MRKPKYYFEVFIDKAGKYRFRLKSRNGRTLASSEAYSSRRRCLATVNAITKYCWISANEKPLLQEKK